MIWENPEGTTGVVTQEPLRCTNAVDTGVCPPRRLARDDREGARRAVLSEVVVTEKGAFSLRR